MSLSAEMDRAGRDVRQVHLDRLRSLGVSGATIADMGLTYWPFGVVKAETIGGGLYQPGNGITHIVLPVLEGGDLIDLCAFRTTAPESWLLRRGNGWCLGYDYGVGSVDPVQLHATPLGWLRAGGDGLCVLDWGARSVSYLDTIERVICADNETAQLLTNALRRPVRLPEIEVRGIAHAA